MASITRLLRVAAQGLLWHATITSASQPQPRADVSACKLAANSDVYLSAGFGYEFNCAPSTGTLRAFMLFIDFSDQQADETAQSLHDFFLPAAADWFATASYGALSLNVTADTSGGFHRMPDTAVSYGFARGLTFEAHQKYIQDALLAYGATIPPTDVLYVIPTANAADIAFSPTFNSNVTTHDGVFVAKKAVTIGVDAFMDWGYLTLNHETGHTMCMPDYYPLDGGPTGQYIGGWDLMGLISGPSPDFFAWDKWRLGWLKDEQVECVAAKGSTTHTLTPLEKAGGAKAVVVKHSSTNALVAEYRTANALDAASCATGVLLYVVSTTVATGEGPVRVLDVTPDSGGCADDELNDAPLSLKGTDTFTFADWGVTVTILEESADEAKIKVDVL
ncbi:M6 metalloprotease [Hypoxylon fragiforme]|uniref:M6 metalloprotease n=1 Tax=Hypoxylon fragiforme TaxID=63214 RepID=UPI0020C5EB78|nr:M6 metalloprotease [Hypoxylon fragiforme]KAI2603335.1 M6 metalloprotease [Hypoxylon fragiforme]